MGMKPRIAIGSPKRGYRSTNAAMKTINDPATVNNLPGGVWRNVACRLKLRKLCIADDKLKRISHFEDVHSKCGYS
jgi:hypothetical protein